MKRFASWLFFVLSIFFFCPSAAAAPTKKLPGDAAQYLPVLKGEIDTFWPAHPLREHAAGTVEQESLWKQNAQLRTSREWGCGFGQFTVAYDKNGKVRFDALTETKRLHSSLKDWNWQDCSNARYQLRGMLLKMKSGYRTCEVQMANTREALACEAAKYNGGAGSVSKRIRLCQMDAKCNPEYWYDNLNTKCAQSNVAVAGYGESFCMINSKYPGRVELRMVKYKGMLD